MVANTDPGKNPGTHWWSFLDTDAKDTLFFFDSFGSFGLFNFIVENDLDIFNKVIPGKFNQILKQDQKVTLLRWTFKRKNYKKTNYRGNQQVIRYRKTFLCILRPVWRIQKNR